MWRRRRRSPKRRRKRRRSNICPPESAAALKKRALSLLARREHSRAELERKLAPHASSQELLHELLDELVRANQLSDARFAEERARWLARKYGAARIRNDLASKGVARDIVSSVAVSDELERARAILARKYRGPARVREEQARRARFLQSRGFSIEVIARLMREDE